MLELFKNMFKKQEQKNSTSFTVPFQPIQEIKINTEDINTKATKANSKIVEDYTDGNNSLAKSTEENYLHTSDLVYACVDYIAKAASQAKPKIYELDRNTNKKVRVKDKLLQGWELSPNPYFTWGEMIELIIQGLTLSGTSFVTFEKVKGRYESWFLSTPSVTKIVPSVKDYIEGVIFNDEIAYKAKEVMVLRNPTLNNAYYGVPTVRPLLDALTLEADAITSLQDFYNGSNLLSGVLESEFAMSNEQIENLRTQFRELFGKSGINRGGTAVLPNKLKYKPIQATPADSKLLDSMAVTDDRVYKVFKLNEAVVGGKSNVLPTRDLMRLTFNTAVRPYLYRIEDQISLFLQQTFKNSDIIFEFDLDRVVELETSLDVKSNSAKTLFATGVATLNEARDLVGLERLDIENADKNLLAASMYGSGAMFIQDDKPIIEGTNTEDPAGSTDPQGGAPDLKN